VSREERLPVLKVAVVGHTNTGKTSLLRTLTRDTTFGDVCDRPGTTRHVEETVLLIDGRPLIELYDTPGLEDSIGLLELLEGQRTDRRADWVDVIHQVVAGPQSCARFEQEAKALRQVLASDVALYVIDARDRVLGKHRDELEILARCARPVVPVLNFVASADARTAEWRQQLTRLNLHSIAEFDTVVLSETAEQRLFEKMRTLLDPFRSTLDALIADRRRRRQELIEGAAELIADLLIDVAAYVRLVPEQDDPMTAVAPLQEAVREREQACVVDLLALFRFRPDDYLADALPIANGRWGLDLFSPESLKRFGLKAGGGAAAGGAAGLAIDVMTGGLTLGAATAVGATIGAVWGTMRTHGQRLAHVFRGYTELRVQDETLKLLALRQLELVQALVVRGHASQDRVRLAPGDVAGRGRWAAEALPEELELARAHPEWSRLSAADRALTGVFSGSDFRRAATRDALKRGIVGDLTAPRRS
jgi:small GTP-binding protein